MPESAEVQLARVQEQLKAVVDGLQLDRDRRVKRDEQIDTIEGNTHNLDKRLETVERQLADSAPTIKEFISIKQKVIGAGILGKWAWMLGGATITLIYTSREAIRSWYLS